MGKRLVLFALAAMAGVLSAASAKLTDAEWAELKHQALERRRLAIYDNDCDDAFCFPKGRAVTVENYLALRTSYLHNYPIDTIVYNATYACFDQLVFPSAEGVLADASWDDWNPDSTAVNIVPELVRMGTSAMDEQLKYAREHDIEFFAGIRINDVHDVIDTPEKPVPFFSKWKRSNPQLMLDGDRTKKYPWGDWSALDFSHKEVRDKFVSIVKAIVERYPVDGISIDLQRTCRFFQSSARGEMPGAAEVAMLSDMFRKVRQVTEHYGRLRGRPILIAVRGLDSIGYSLAVGFDWEGLMKEGAFDIFLAGGTIHLQPWAESVALCHRYGVKCYASIDEALCGFQAPRLGRTEPVSYFARIAAAYQQGVDGIYYFNLFSERYVKSIMLGGPEMYRGLEKRYHLNPTTLWPPNYIIKDGERFNGFPLLSPRFKKTLKPGGSLECVIEFADDVKALQAEGLPVRLAGTLIARQPAAIAIASNGIAWKSVDAFGDVARFDIPLQALRPGVNRVRLTNTSKQEVEVTDAAIDLLLHKAEEADKAPAPISDWSAQATDASTLAAGKYAYQLVPMDAEVEVALGKGESVTIYASIGGMLTQVRLSADHIEMPYSGAEPIRLRPVDAPRKLRFHVEEKTARLYLDGHWLEAGTRSVSMSLKADLQGLQGDVFTVVRNGGIALEGAAAAALRLKMEK